jgi:serine/threonine protein kinase
MHAVIETNVEPIPGYRLLELVGKGGFGEVWKCEAPGGLFKAIKFIHGPEHSLEAGGLRAVMELQSLQHVRTIRHPFLLSIERVEVIDGRLVIVMELADRSLHDRLADCRAAGQPGVPRDELLAYLREAAEALDVLNLEYGLQHLDVKPRNLLLVGRHVKVADFGMVNSLADLRAGAPSANAVRGAAPLYASPETFDGRITLSSDQYSLAISYAELLTGEVPFQGTNFYQLALLHAETEPDLGRLPEFDRAAVRRALAKDPQHRFPSCTAFVQALTASPPSAERRAARVEPPSASAPSSTFPAQRSEAGQAYAEADIALDRFRFLECVARLSVAEVWKAQAPDGRRKLVQYLFNFGGPEDRPGEDPVQRLLALRHSVLATADLGRGTPGRLVVVADLPEATLVSRLKECQIEGHPGIPRPELLAKLRPVAECLDDLFRTERLQHLGLTPRHLWLLNGRLSVADFGLVELLWLPCGQVGAAINPRYVAPEVLEGRIGPACDQYSLALIVQEMLTGFHPFRHVNQRNLLAARLRGKPDLTPLPSSNRPVLARALDPDPTRRFRTCAELLAALAEEKGSRIIEDREPRIERPKASSATPLLESLTFLRAPAAVAPAQLPSSGRDIQVPRSPILVANLEKIVGELVGCEEAAPEVREFRDIRYVLRPGHSIEHHCFARLLLNTIALKLDGFRQQWHAEVVSRPRDADSDQIFVYQIRLPGSLWNVLRGRQPGLEARISVPHPHFDASALTEVLIRIRPVGCEKKQGAKLLTDLGPSILESVRSYLQPHPERRGQERLQFEKAVQVCPVLEDLQLGEAIVSQAQDISAGGMKLLLPCRPSSLDVSVQLPCGSAGGPLLVPARIVRVLPWRDGRYEVGLSFLR